MARVSRPFYCTSFIAAALLLCAPNFVNGQTPDAKSKPSGSIAGHALVSGKGAPGIPVAAYGGDMMNRRAAAQTITDSEGRYRLFGLAPGTYQVVAQAPNYAPAEPMAPGSFGPFAGVGKSIVLAPAENLDEVDLKLVRGGVITGRVKDAEGKPVIEQQVALMPVDEKGAPTRASIFSFYNYQMYQTDDRGIYRIYGLPAGHYKVSVGSDPNGGGRIGATVYYPQTFFGDVTDPAKATIVELAEGSETGNIDIQLGHRGDTYSATGRIIDSETGQPIAGIRFMYGLAPKNQSYFSGGYIGVPTNARGEFRIDGIEPGRYGVTVSSDFDSTSVYSDPAYFEVTDGDVSNIEVKATRGNTLSGVLVTDGITNKEVLAQLSSMRVYARVTSTTNPQAFSGGSSIINSDLSFSVGGLRPGRGTLFLSSFGGPGVRGVTISRVEREGIDVTQTLDLKAGQPLADLRVLLVYGTGTVRGTIKFENGAPPANTRLYVSARREGASYPGNFGAQVDSRGRFVLMNLPAGTYEIILNLGFSTGPQTRQPPPKQFVTVADDAEAEVTFTIDLKPAGGGQ